MHHLLRIAATEWLTLFDVTLTTAAIRTASDTGEAGSEGSTWQPDKQMQTTPAYVGRTRHGISYSASTSISTSCHASHASDAREAGSEGSAWLQLQPK